jgi:TonB family protein
MNKKGLLCVVVILVGVIGSMAQEKPITLADLDRYFQQSEKVAFNSPWSVRTVVNVGASPKGPWEDYSGWEYSVVPPDRAHLVYHSGRKGEFLHIGPLSYRKGEDGMWAISNDTIKGSMVSPANARRLGDGVISYTQSRSGGIIVVTVVSRPSADADPSDTRTRTYIIYFADLDIAGRGMITGEESIVHNGSKWVRTTNIYTFDPNIRLDEPVLKTARQFTSVPATTSPEAIKSSPTDEPIVILSKPRPIYSNDARSNGVQGTVILSVTFESDGTIGAIGVVKGLELGLTEAAMDAVRKITFTPARQNGNPVTVRKQLSYSFSIY